MRRVAPAGPPYEQRLNSAVSIVYSSPGLKSHRSDQRLTFRQRVCSVLAPPTVFQQSLLDCMPGSFLVEPATAACGSSELICDSGAPV